MLQKLVEEIVERRKSVKNLNLMLELGHKFENFILKE